MRFQEELPIPNRLIVPHFLPQSIIEMNEKVREGRHQYITHHGLIMIIVIDSLNHLKAPILWIDFVDMDKDAFINRQAHPMT